MHAAGVPPHLTLPHPCLASLPREPGPGVQIRPLEGGVGCDAGAWVQGPAPGGFSVLCLLLF